jgi:lysophospholipase L1-like esterase
MSLTSMPRLPTGKLARTLSRLSANIRTIEKQREPHAAFWDRWNANAIEQDGPLWVALGDSSSQGIGATDPAESWIPKMLPRLREETGAEWRVLNLSMTGAKLEHILKIALPKVRQLEDAGHRPQLVTHLAGANDLMAVPSWAAAPTTIQHVLDALPDDSIVARVGERSALLGGAVPKVMNRTIEREAAHRPFHLFWPWDWPSRDGLAIDKWHPGPKGYDYMVELIWPAIAARLALSNRPVE